MIEGLTHYLDIPGVHYAHSEGVELFSVGGGIRSAIILPVAQICDGRTAQKNMLVICREKLEELAVRAYYGQMEPLEGVVWIGGGSYALTNGGFNQCVLSSVVYGARAHVLARTVREPDTAEHIEHGLSIPSIVENKGMADLVQIVQSIITRLDSWGRNRQHRLHKYLPSLFPIPTQENTGLSDEERERPVLRGKVLST